MPMKIHRLHFAADDYASLYPVDEVDLDRFEPLDGTRVAEDWEVIEMFWDNQGGALPPSDFHTGFGGDPIFSARTVEVLGDLLEGRGELLPLRTIEGEAFFLFNVTRLSDALDERGSELLQVRRKILDVLEPEFHPERLVGETIFKLTQLPRMWVYVIDEFRRRAEGAGLTGFAWDGAVWSDD